MIFLRRLIHYFHQVEDAILVLIFACLVGLSVTQIVLRNFFDGGWIWADSALRILVLWLAFWGAGIAARHNQHIRIEIASHYFSPFIQRVLAALVDFACAVISAFVAWYSAIFVWNESQYGDMAFANIPQWWCEVVIPFAFVLLSMRFIAQCCFQIFKDSGFKENEGHL